MLAAQNQLHHANERLHDEQIQSCCSTPSVSNLAATVFQPPTLIGYIVVNCVATSNNHTELDKAGWFLAGDHCTSRSAFTAWKRDAQEYGTPQVTDEEEWQAGEELRQGQERAETGANKKDEVWDCVQP